MNVLSTFICRQNMNVEIDKNNTFVVVSTFHRCNYRNWQNQALSKYRDLPRGDADSFTEQVNQNSNVHERNVLVRSCIICTSSRTSVTASSPLSAVRPPIHVDDDVTLLSRCSSAILFIAIEQYNSMKIHCLKPSSQVITRMCVHKSWPQIHSIKATRPQQQGSCSSRGITWSSVSTQFRRTSPNMHPKSRSHLISITHQCHASYVLDINV